MKENTVRLPHLIRLLLFLFLMTCNGLALRAEDDRFPRPPELQPDIDFWVSVFSDYSSDEGVLHDNRHLGVIYERLPMPAATGRRERQRKVQIRRKHYQVVLRRLAGGKRNRLSREERRVLELWPEDVSNATLGAAVKRIRYQQGLADRFREGLQRAGRWRSFIQAELEKHGVAPELAALPHVESSYNPDARSHVGASGIWQFTPGTGRRFMQVDHVVDERNDPFAATEAAARLLAYNYSIAGNWPMAITAYNHGLSGVRRAMRRYGDTAYTDILRNYRSRTFGFASRNFYVAFLAAMQIDQNPEEYFPGIVPDDPVAYARYTLPDYVPADAAAAALGVSERQLARHNPALQATIWQGSKYLPRDFELKLPASMLQRPMPELLGAIPPEQRHSRQLPDLFHTVVRGDTLSEIAADYSTTVTTLVRLNGLGSRHRIRAGQRLRLPAAGPAPEVVAAAAAEPAVAAAEQEPARVAAADQAPAMVAGAVPEEGSVTDLFSKDTLSGDLGATVLGAIQAALLSDPSDYTVAQNNTIEVQPLETLGHYADWLGIRTQRLRDINGLTFGAPVAVGQRIKLDFRKVDSDQFESLRGAYQRQQQDAFFRAHTITGVTDHVVQRGESIWILALRRYRVPVWLFRQYNPELDPQRVQPGTHVRFPTLVVNERA